MLCLVLNSSEKRTDIEERLSLLFDVFGMVGDKLVAYIRLEDTSEQIVKQTQMEVDFFLREVACKKLGHSSPDYYFRFFKFVGPKADHRSSSDTSHLAKTWDDMGFGERKSGPWMFNLLPYVLMRKGIDQAYFYRHLPILEAEDAGLLNRAIKKKLSSMSTLRGCFEDMARITKKEEIYFPLGFPFSYKPIEQSIPLCVNSTRRVGSPVFPTKSWENKMTKPATLKPVFPALMLSQFPKVAKLLIK